MARARSTDDDTVVSNPDEKIVMTHDVTGGRTVVTRRQLDEVWADRGWTEDTSAEVEVVAAENAAVAATVGDTDENPEA